MRSRLPLILIVVAVLGCGGSSDPTSPSSNGSNTSGSGNTKTLTGTFNGAPYNATLISSVWGGSGSGQVSINATDGTRAFMLTGLGVTAPGTYSFAPGNSNSGIVQWVDGANFYSTGYNGTGSVTFTVLQIGRVAGSFNVSVKTLGAPSTVQTLALVGTFDIKFP